MEKAVEIFKKRMDEKFREYGLTYELINYKDFVKFLCGEEFKTLPTIDVHCLDCCFAGGTVYTGKIKLSIVSALKRIAEQGFIQYVEPDYGTDHITIKRNDGSFVKVSFSIPRSQGDWDRFYVGTVSLV